MSSSENSNSETDTDSDYSSDDSYFGNNGNIFNNEIINEKYLLIKKIGYGAFSSVWLSFNYIDNKYYAIKIQNYEDFYEGKIEIKILNKLKKINCNYINNIIESFIEIKDNNNYICMVFDLCVCNIYQLIRHDRNKICLNNIKNIIRQTLIAINEIHKLKYYHTDIKPENLLLVGLNPTHKNIIEQYNKCNFNEIFQGLKLTYFKTNNWDINNKNKKKDFNKKMKKIFLKKTNEIILKKIDLYKDELDYNSGNEDSEEDDDFKFDESILNNINIKLTDFGTVYKISHKSIEEIQTRHYRSPEVILGLQHNEKVDLWSLGCLTLELCCNIILFNPEKDDNFHRDFYHLHDIQKLCGNIPEYMIENSPNKSYYFKKYKFKKKIQYNLLEDFLKEKNIYSIELLNFLKNTLNIDYKKRLSAEECLKLSWLN